MDPNEALARVRQQVDAVLHPRGLDVSIDELATMLAENFRALDEWLVRGGFLPTAWKPELRASLLGERVVVEPLGPPDPAGVEAARARVERALDPRVHGALWDAWNGSHDP
jgi:hypothetical protein